MIRFATLPLVLLGASLAPYQVRAEPGTQKPNVLFIVVDDLRPELGCAGISHIRSSRIDRLAGRGVFFRRAYCQFPVCGPSRASLLSGLRPTRSRFVDNRTRKDREAPDVPSLPAHFRNHGYVTISNGKVYHVPDDDLNAWSEPPWAPRGDWEGRKVYRIAYLEESNKAIARKNAGNGPPFEASRANDSEYPDGKIAERTIDDLRRLARGSKPFFLAVGFTKPHLPFACPKRYWEQIDPISVPTPPTAPVSIGIPRAAFHDSPELRKYWGVPRKGTIPSDLAATLVRGYASCITATDAQIGRVLDELDRLDLRRSTVIVLWGDHGWNLGDHGMWGKACLFETALRTPLILSGPGVPQGIATDALVELIDVYPTLCSLAGLPAAPHLEGEDLLPVRERVAAYSRCRTGSSVRTTRYRYTEWTDASGTPVERVLFDHTTDPGETENLAHRPESKEIVRELSQLLR
jgi:arylsulfatase A-like enzyme